MRAQRHGGPCVGGSPASNLEGPTPSLPAVSAHTESVQPAGGDCPKPAVLGADDVTNAGSGWEPRSVIDVIQGQEPTPLTYDPTKQTDAELELDRFLSRTLPSSLDGGRLSEGVSAPSLPAASAGHAYERESMCWFDHATQALHIIAEEGHLFRWTRTTHNPKGEPETLDYGLIPGGAYVAILNLRESLSEEGTIVRRTPHLAEVYRANGNRLPVNLTVNSAEELLVEREADRTDDERELSRS